MVKEPIATQMTRFVVQMEPAIHSTDEEFFAFCQLNRHLRIERTATGEIIIMPPAGGETGSRNAEITMLLRIWAKQDGRGIAFDSSAAFVLPNTAILSPDASWVLGFRLAMLTAEQKEKFLPLCPDFVIELRSPSDRLPDLQAKMEEYIDNGAQLGWLIDPEKRQVFIYRPDAPVRHLSNPTALSGEPLLPGFVLPLADIWNPGF